MTSVVCVCMEDEVVMWLTSAMWSDRTDRSCATVVGRISNHTVVDHS